VSRAIVETSLTGISNPSLAGRLAVVTGAAGGIGGAIVRALMAQGAIVHGLDRDRAGLERLAAVLEQGRFVPHEIDLTDKQGTDRALVELMSDLGGHCDILVNNAGVSQVRSFAETDDGLLDFLLAVNFTGAFRVTRTLLPALKRGRCAVVVNIASELALVGQSGYTAYCGTKGAVLAWSRALAVELAGEGIRVNAVCPGPIDTAMLAAEFATSAAPLEARRAEIASVPLGRVGNPADIAAVVAFLASDAASFVTGAAWSVDGGKTSC
jgi:NAD(P)-dependent dehydrogenase (short-subunit alcohol dehydrogenase family)